jgi:steroid delta-isomerase-like uncharacterized protein
MVSEDNIQVVLESIEHFNSRTWDKYLELCTSDSLVVDMATGAKFEGHAGWMEFLENATTAFPDCTLNIDHILADEKGEVASQCTFKGTNLGDMVMNENTVPPSGRVLETKAAGFFSIREGKIAAYT